MAGFYRKKKRSAGPSKNEEKVQRGRDAERLAGAGNSLAARYPSLRRLELRLEFLSPGGAVLGEETRSFGPGDPCDLAAPCPGRCGVGDFGLAARVAAMVGVRQTSLEASAACAQPLYAGASELCGCQLRLRAAAEYEDGAAA